MTRDDIDALADVMATLYGDRFPGFTPAMAQFWYEEMVHLPNDLVRAGLRRWVRHHHDRTPSLDALCEQVELVRDEQARLRPTPASPALTRLGSPATLLADAAAAQAANPGRTPDAATYGHLMATLAERHLGPWLDARNVVQEKLTLEGLATQCRIWAAEQRPGRPQLAADLAAAAQQYDEMAAEAAVPF